MVSNTCILNIDPVNVISLLKKYPKLGGVSTIEVAVKEPELFLIPFSKIERWTKMLWKYKGKSVLSMWYCISVDLEINLCVLIGVYIYFFFHEGSC